MQALGKQILAILAYAWEFSRKHPRKSIAAGVGVGATSMALMSGVSSPPPAFHPGNITNIPGTNGQVFESNGDGTYTFGTDDGGVGGGATELSGLDDVADTLTGNSGEFIGWAGTEWDDLTISLDTLSDATITSGSTGEVLRYSGTAWVDSTLDFDDLANTTITSWASGEVPRWNGSALVDSKLASTDLSDFAATIVGTTNDVLGWNGSAWDDVVLTLDMVSDVTNTGTDGQVLASNGDGTATFETLVADVDATGITDGYVYTADGDATPAWEAPSVGGLLTPDSGTTVNKGSTFSPIPYGASMLDTDAYVSTSTTTSTATFDAGTNVVTTSGAHGLADGDGICFTTSNTLPALTSGTLAASTRVFVDVLSSTTFSLHTTRAAAAAGTGDLDFADTGTGTHTARLKTTVTFNNSAGTPTASANDYAVNNWILLLRSGPECTLGASQTTVDSVTASYATKVGTDPTWTFNDGTDIITLSADVPLATADPVRVSTDGVLPTGSVTVNNSTTYYARRLSGTAPGLATTLTLHANTTDANSGSNIITLTGGSGTHTMLGYTPWYATARPGDGEGGWGPASADVLTANTWNYRTSGDMTTAVRYRFDVPTGSRSMAIYGFTTSSRDLITVTDAEGLRAHNPNNTSDGQLEFQSVSDSGGNSSLNGSSIGTYYVADDIVEVNSTSTSDTEYDVKKRVLSRSTSAIVINQAFSDTASGYLNEAFVEYQDYGQTVRLSAYKGLPDVENPSYQHRTLTVMPIGSGVWDATNNRHWTVYDSTKSGPFQNRSGSVTPTWTTGANAMLGDGNNVLKRSLEWVPTEDTSGAVRKAMRAKIQSVPTSTTAVLQDAAFADVANGLYATHDDTMPLRYCVAAARTWNKGATIEIPPGAMPIYSPKYGTTDPDGVAWHTNVGTTNGPRPALIVLGDANESVNISFKLHPSTTIRWRAFESTVRIDASTVQSGTTEALGLTSAPALFALSSRKFDWDGGRVIWEDFAGGLSEHDAVTSANSGLVCFTVATSGNASNLQPRDIRFTNATFFVPYWFESGASDDDYSYWAQAKMLVSNCQIAVRGGDGAQTLLAQGDFHSEGNWWGSYGRLSSHAHYWNVGKFNYVSRGDRIYGIDTPDKNSISIRGSSDNKVTRHIAISDLFGLHSGSVLIGDSTTSNPVQNAQLTNINGANIEMSEAEDIQLSNIHSSVTITEDCKNIQIDNLQGALTASPTDGVTNLQVNKIAGVNAVTLNNLMNSTIKDIQFTHNYVSDTTSVTNDNYAWTATGSNSEYYLTLKSTGGKALASQPTHAVIDGRVIVVGTTGLGSMVAGTAIWLDPASLGYSTLVVKTQNGYDPDEEPYDFISTAAITGNTIGLCLGSLYNTTIDGVSGTRSDAQSLGLVRTVGAASTSKAWVNSWLKNVCYEQFSTAPGGTFRVIDLGTGTNLFVDSGIDGAFLRPSVGASNRLSMVQGTFTANSKFAFKNFDTPLSNTDAQSGMYITAADGHGTLENCKFQTNESLMILDVTADTLVTLAEDDLIGTAAAGSSTGVTLPSTALTFDDAYNNLDIVVVHANGRVERNSITDYVGSTKVATVRRTWNQNPSNTSAVYVASHHLLRTVADAATVVPVRLYCQETFPGATVDGGGALTVEGETWWYRPSNDTLYNSEANAVSAGATGNVEFTGSNVVVLCRVENLANASNLSTTLPFNGTAPSLWVKSAKNVDLRGGGGVWTYAEITADTHNVALMPVDVHNFTTDDTANVITGFEGGWPGRTIRIINRDSADNLVFDHQNAGANSLRKNQINSPTGADFTLGPLETITLVWVDAATGWVIQNYVASLNLPEIMPLQRLSLWAIEPKRIQLALAA